MSIAGYIRGRILYPLAERWLGRAIRRKLRVLREAMVLPAAERRRHAQRQLAEVLTRAAAEVPYYRDLFRQIGFKPHSVARNGSFLRDIPYLTKEIIREQGARLLNETMDPAGLHLRRTGGSTGLPAKIYYSTDALDWTAAVNLLIREWAGKDAGRSEAHLSSRLPGRSSRIRRWRERVKCLVLGRTNLVTDRLDEPGLEELWRQLRTASAYLLHGHPSTVYALACHVQHHGYPTKNVIQVFESTGETLSGVQRRLVQSVFGCRVLNRYGSAEFGVAAFQRSEETDGLLVLDPVVWPETCEDDLVFTTLLNPAMPLIRYRIGDCGKLHRNEEGVFLENLVGRMHDLVRIGAVVYPTHYLQDLLERVGGIEEFQFEPRPDGLMLRLVVTPDASRERIAAKIGEWWGAGVIVEFTGFDGLRRAGERAKFRHVVTSDVEAA